MKEKFKLTGEDDARIAGVANHYGTGTRSYNRSAEKRETDRQRAKATADYQHREIAVPATWLMCRCAAHPHPHQAHDMVEIYYFKPWHPWRGDVESK